MMKAFNDFAEGLKNAAISVWPHLYLPLVWGGKEEKRRIRRFQSSPAHGGSGYP